MRYIVLISVLLCSCEKFLDKKADASQAVPRSISDLQAVLDNSEYMNVQHTPAFGEATAGDYYINDDTYNAVDLDPQAVYRWDRYQYNFDNDWDRAYHCIYHANFCLEGVDKIEVNPQNTAAWNNVKGSALFFRAYYALGILWEYAKLYDAETAANDLGIAIRTGSDFNQKTVRSSVADCYRQVINDAHGAISLLPDQPLNRMRPSKPAAFGLLARTYLSMQNYDSAYFYSDKALNIRHALIDFNNGIPMASENPEIIFETSMLATITILYPGYSIIDSVLVKSYTTGDLRPVCYFQMDGDKAYFTGTYTGNPGFHFTGFATDELLLMRAECAARLGNANTAMNDLNTLIRTRWDANIPYVPFVAGSPEEALDIVLTERHKTLVMRGVRFMDIKRFNNEGRNIVLHRTINGETYTLLPESNYYNLPLPQDIIDQTDIPQN